MPGRAMSPLTKVGVAVGGGADENDQGGKHEGPSQVVNYGVDITTLVVQAWGCRFVLVITASFNHGGLASPYVDTEHWHSAQRVEKDGDDEDREPWRVRDAVVPLFRHDVALVILARTVGHKIVQRVREIVSRRRVLAKAVRAHGLKAHSLRVANG